MSPAESYDVFLRPDLPPVILHFFTVFGAKINVPDGGTVIYLRCSRVDTEDATYLAVTLETGAGKAAERFRIPHAYVLSISGPSEPSAQRQVA